MEQANLPSVSAPSTAPKGRGLGTIAPSDYAIQLTLRIRPCARLISLSSVLWPRAHGTPLPGVPWPRRWDTDSVVTLAKRSNLDFSMQMSSGTGPRP